MRVYKVQYYNEHLHVIEISWASTSVGAQKIVDRGVENYKYIEKEYEVTCVDIPTDQDGLINWLTRNVYIK